MSSVTLGVSNLSLAGMNSLLPDKVLTERSNKVEFKAWYEKIMNYLGCYGLESLVNINVDKDEEKAGKSKTRKNSSVDVGLHQKSWLAYSIIMSRLDDQLIVQFSTAEKGNASALMNAIYSRFSAVNFFSKLQA